MQRTSLLSIEKKIYIYWWQEMHCLYGILGLFVRYFRDCLHCLYGILGPKL